MRTDSNTLLQAGLNDPSEKPPLRRMPKSHSLSISLPRPGADAGDRGLKSPKSPSSPPPPLPSRDHNGDTYGEGYDGHLHSPITSLPTPPSPRSPKQRTKSIFSNKLGNKSTPKVSKTDTPVKPSEEASSSAGQASQVYQYRKSPGSTPELSLQPDDGVPRSGSSLFCFPISPFRHSGYTRLLTPDVDPIPISAEAPEALAGGQTIKSSSVPHMSSDAPAAPKEKERRRDDKRHKFLGLGRKGSIKDKGDETQYGEKQRSESRLKEPNKPPRLRDDVPLKTAPIGQERGFREMMNSTLRNHSADRYQDKNESSDDNTSVAPSQTLKAKGSTRTHVRDAAEAGSGFLTHFGNRAADGIGRAGKALAKLGRSGSGHNSDLPLSLPRQPHELRVIKLSLVEQTRITRISKRLEHSRDKTEFWMPALPWRCIDYLNAKGIESEGIYRVPGSTREVEHWEMRFDTEYDIDLLGPDIPIYDINTVASVFKNWLRNLPDEIVPTTVQNEVIKAVCPDGGSAPLQAPKELKKALSKLPPFNYYLLFAITCHLSLLNAHSDITKMTYNNLRICLQPSLRLSGPFFQWLVEDWRNCWEGCFPEKEFLQKEYEWIDKQTELAQQKLGSKPQDRSGARSATPAGNRREERDVEKERPKTSHKEAKVNLADRRPTQQFDIFPLPPQNQQQQQRAASNTSSGSTVRPSTSYTASSTSTAFDASQAPPMPAMPKSMDKDEANRAISSSGSSKPSVASYDGRSTPDQATNGRDVSSPQRQQPTTARSNGTSRKESSRSRERQGRDKDGNPLRLKGDYGHYEQYPSSNAHITSAMKTDATNARAGNSRKNGEKEECDDTDETAETMERGRELGAKGDERTSLKAPQISPMKPLSPMGSVDMGLGMNLGLDP